MYASTASVSVPMMMPPSEPAATLSSISVCPPPSAPPSLPAVATLPATSLPPILEESVGVAEACSGEILTLD
jgi:hypothetical protein